jgi:chromosome segregation ATPase
MGQLWFLAGRKGVGMRGTVYLAAAMLAGASGAALLGTPPVAAVDSEIVELQDSIKQITQGQKEAEATLLQTAAVSKTRMEESMNTVNKMTGNMTALQKTVQDVQVNSGTRLDTMSMQIHTSSDNLQETLARVGKLNQQLVALQNVLRGIDSKLAHSAPPSSGTPAPAPRVPPKR